VRRARRERGSAEAYAALPVEPMCELGCAAHVGGAIDWLEAQREAGYDHAPVSVDEPEPAVGRPSIASSSARQSA